MELIGDSAFSGCSSLKAVDLPDGIITTYDSWGNVNSYGIGRYAFYGCSSVKSVKLPSQMQALNTGVFNGCTSLSDIILPETMKSIGYEVFSNCDSLKEIKLPEALTSISSYAFSNCDSLTRIKLPASLTSIGESAFQDCIRLTAVYIPEAVTSIGQNAFKGCTLMTIYGVSGSYAETYAMENNIPFVEGEMPDTEFVSETSEDWEYLTDGTSANLTSYLGDSNKITIPKTINGKKVIGVKSGLLYDHRDMIKSVVIEAELTSLPDSFFSGFSKLESVTLPDCMTDMGEYVFNGCGVLT